MRYKQKKEFTRNQKLIGTMLCLLLYRLLCFVPLPFVNSSYIKTLIGNNGSLGLLNLMSGGSLGNLSLMALGIGPWITASIVMQLLGMVFVKIGELQKDSYGRKKYKGFTFVLAIILAFMESMGFMLAYGSAGYLSTYTWYTILIPALLMMAGAGFLSLMGWYIEERLFGNGTSLILTTGILSSYVNDGLTVGYRLSYDKTIVVTTLLCILAVLALFFLFLYTVFISSCEKRIPITNSKKVSGSNGWTNTNMIPMKLITGGVVPVIFASTIITIPAVIGTMMDSDAKWLSIFNISCWLKMTDPWASIGFVIYIVLIMAFSYFCQMMYVNPMELAKNLQKSGGMIPGIRPGKPTADYITNQAKWLTGLGGIFLCIVAAIPIVVSGMLGLSNLSFLGTSILITVSTLDETWKTWKMTNRTGRYGSNIL